MRKIYPAILLLGLLISCPYQLVISQVLVTGSTGLDGNYPCLGGVGGLFEAIELGSDQTGNNITVTITNDIPDEPGGSLLFGRNWNILRIIPSGSRTITSTISGWIIGLAFANNIVIDGLNTGGNSLTLINNSTGSLGSTVMFSNNSSFDTLRNVTCRGSGVGDAVVYITNAFTGNHNILIENCDISGSLAGTPSYGIASISGSYNNDNTIRNCNIHDIYNSTGDSYGIYIAFGAGRTTIENNRIYQSVPRIPLSGTPTFTGIAVGFTEGDGFIIRNNIIGGSNASGTGYSVFGSTTTAPAFKGIRISHVGFTPAAFPSRTEITGNRISGIDITSTKTATTGNSFIFSGIELANGTNTDSIRCSNNIIGGISGNDSIKITALATTANLPCIGIYNSSTRGNTIDSNIVGAITMISTSGARTTGFAGIQSDPSSTATIIPIRNNTIGNADVPNSITSNYTGAGGQLFGIRLGSSLTGGNYEVKSNIVQNIRHTGVNTGTAANASVTGFQSIASSNNKLVIEKNTFINLSNTAVTASALEVTGIRFISPTGAGAVPAVISKNKVYALSIPNATNINSKVAGLISLAGGTSYVTNNMVCVGENSPGKAYAFDISGSTVKMYNNSFRITGSSAIGEGAALLRSSVNSLEARNNIYYNERAGTPNSQYAVKFVSAISAVLPYTGSNNLYYSPGPNMAAISSTNYANLPVFSFTLNTAAPNAETAGKTAAVSFASSTDLHTADANVVNGGANLSATTPPLTDDVDGEPRISCYDMGADEISYSPAPNTATWTGAIDSKWCSPCNWDKGAVPVATDNITIPSGLLNQPLLNTAASCITSLANNLDINAGAAMTIETGGTLEVYGNFINNGTYTHTGGDVILKGAAAQTIYSSTSPLNFYNLQVNGNGLKQLSASTTINSVLTMTNGDLSIGNNQLMAVAVTGGSITSHIITDGTGMLTIPAIGAGPVLFPIGPEAASYNPLTFTNGSGIDYSARVEVGINPSIAFPGIAVNRTWTINSSGFPPGPVGVMFEYASGHASAGFNYSSAVEVGKFISPVWHVVQSGITPTGSYKAASSLSSFNAPFAIGNIGAFLAIDCIIRCTAGKNNNNAIINFDINDCSSVIDFEIQRSVNNAAFETFVVLPATTTLLQYSYTDAAIPQGEILYRIKANRRNSSPKYSNIAAVINGKKGWLITSLYPNPVNTNANLALSTARPGKLTFRITDFLGKTVKQWQSIVTEGNNTIIFNAGGLARGVYYLLVTDNEKKELIRFIKQ